MKDSCRSPFGISQTFDTGISDVLKTTPAIKFLATLAIDIGSTNTKYVAENSTIIRVIIRLCIPTLYVRDRLEQIRIPRVKETSYPARL